MNCTPTSAAKVRNIRHSVSTVNSWPSVFEGMTYTSLKATKKGHEKVE